MYTQGCRGLRPWAEISQRLRRRLDQPAVGLDQSAVGLDQPVVGLDQPAAHVG